MFVPIRIYILNHCTDTRRKLGSVMDEQPPDISDPETLENDLSKEAMLEILQRLKTEHRAIDSEIKALTETGVMDMLKLKRMKKVKLSMKDKIAFIENQLAPDIIA